MPARTIFATVAVIRTRPETVVEDHARLLRVARLDRPVAPGGLALCLDQEPGAADLPGSASPPWQLEGVACALVAAGWPADNLAVVTSAATERDADREPLATWRRVTAGCGLALPRPSAGTGAGGPPRLLLGGLRIDHRLGVPGSLGVLAAHLLGPAALADLDHRPQDLIDAWRRLGPHALAGAVLDATVCGDGREVRDRRPIAAHLLLAGTDPVAVDAVAARLAGLDPRRLPLVAAAAAAGLGCADLTHIELVGDLTDGLPRLGLEAATTVSAPRSSARSWWLAWARSLPRVLPVAAWRARRQRSRHETSPWGRLRRHYTRHDRHGGGTA